MFALRKSAGKDKHKEIVVRTWKMVIIVSTSTGWILYRTQDLKKIFIRVLLDFSWVFAGYTFKGI